MRRRQPQSGYALLLVIAMAGAIAMMLYQQLPRIAFESMRAKEEMLIERGEQYTRAIKLFVGKNKRYPASLDELEKFGGVRYLRRKYKDPFTGKDEWRLVHVDASGRLTDSLVEKKEEKKPSQNTFVSEFAGIGQTPAGAGQSGVNVALRRRPSDGQVDNSLPLPSGSPEFPAPGQPTVPNPVVPQEQQPQGQQPPNPFQPVPAAGAPGANPQTGMPPSPGQNPAAQMIQGVLMAPAPGQTAQPVQPGQTTGYPQPMGYPQPGSPQAQGYAQMGYPQPGQQPQPGAGQQPTYPVNPATQMGRPGSAPPGSPNAAIEMIRQSLTTPSPNIPMNMAPGLQLGGGIAGVASKFEGPSIKVYNEQQEYHKWEFIYDPKKDKSLLQQLGPQGAPQAQPGRSPGSGPGSSPVSGPPGFPGPGGFPQNPNVPPGTQPPPFPGGPARPGNFPPQPPGFPPQPAPGSTPPGYPPGIPGPGRR